LRLTEYEAKIIKEIFLEVFNSGEIYLFGSRVDNSKRGGDIDLYIDLPYKLNISKLRDLKNRFRIKLYNKIGEQKIDVVISKDKSRDIEKEALDKGIRL